MKNGLSTLAVIAALAAPGIALAKTCPPGSVAQGGICVTAPVGSSTQGISAATPAPAGTPQAAAGATTPQAAASTTTPPATASTTTTAAAAGTTTPPASGSSTPPAQETTTCAQGMMAYNGGCFPATAAAFR